MSLLTDDANPLMFSGSVGRYGDNTRADVIRAQVLLANAGYFALPYPGVPTGWPGEGLHRAITRLQKDAGAEQDGLILPVPRDGVSETGVGETARILTDAVGDRLHGRRLPTPEEADDFWDSWRPTQGEHMPASKIEIVTTRHHAETGLPPGTILSDVYDEVPALLKAGQREAKSGAPARTTSRPNTPSLPVVPRAPVGVPSPSPVPEFRQGPDPVQSRQPITPLTREQQQQIQEWLQHSSDPMRSFFDRQGMGHPADKRSRPPSGDIHYPADHDVQRHPDFPQPEEDLQAADFARPQRGHIVISDNGEEVFVPPLLPWADALSPERRQIADAFNAAFHLELRKTGSGGGRGGAWTQEGINTLIKSCLEEFERHPALSGKITHVAGGKSGKTNLKLREEHLWNYDRFGGKVRRGSRRADLVFEYAGRVVERLRGNTVDTKRGGEALTRREQEAADGIRSLAEDEIFFSVGKWKKGTGQDILKKDADAICRSVAIDFIAHIKRKESALPEAGDQPKNYPGSSSARKAMDRKATDRKAKAKK